MVLSTDPGNGTVTQEFCLLIRQGATPKVIWFPSIFELLFDESKKVVESMSPMPKVPTVSANR
jgi:hypothetical protein